MSGIGELTPERTPGGSSAAALGASPNAPTPGTAIAADLEGTDA